MFRSKRKDSAIRTLVAETLVLAKTHGYVEKIEHELEEELQREETEPPSNFYLAKWRRNGEQLLKNKYTLLAVALFCVTECALILGELILDLHKVKDVLEAQEAASIKFVQELHKLYPSKVPDGDWAIESVYSYILQSTIQWNDTGQDSNQDHSERHRRSSETYSDQTLYVTLTHLNGTSYINSQTGNDTQEVLFRDGDHVVSEVMHPLLRPSHVAKSHSLEEEIAHAFHKASITILSLLVFETILKALCAGTAFFQRKLETFDLCVVVISFIVDLVCMQIMPRYKIQDFVFILAFLLPWRVIRVVNSLVVAVQDHEHFRLKLIYGRKKKIVNSLRETDIKLQLFRAQCNALKRLCYTEGIEESKIDHILMVEEHVVNKAGKSKCKVKIDNSSVIVLNDKSDLPNLSPRPSLLNLVDSKGRRKSMQPQWFVHKDTDIFSKEQSKESSIVGFFKTRARSNSESGRGTLSSPEDHGPPPGPGEGGGYSGLNTPVVINRKSSLNSPLIATHVRNILTSLEEKGSALGNGNCSRLGRASSSEDSEGDLKTGRRSASQEKPASHSGTDIDSSESNGSKLCRRRASLQPQKRVDEDDEDLSPTTSEVPETHPPVPTIVRSNSSVSATFAIEEETSSGLVASRSSPVIPTSLTGSPRTQRQGRTAAVITPTMIQIHPPSNAPTPSRSPSPGSLPSGNNFNNLISTLESLAQSQYQQQVHHTTNDKTCHENISNKISMDNHEPLTTNNYKPPPPTGAIPSDDTSEKPCPVVSTQFRPKASRTPSDIENENNLMHSDLSEGCGSKSNEDCYTGNTSVDDIVEELDNEEDTSDQDIGNGVHGCAATCSTNGKGGEDSVNRSKLGNVWKGHPILRGHPGLQSQGDSLSDSVTSVDEDEFQSNSNLLK